MLVTAAIVTGVVVPTAAHAGVVIGVPVSQPTIQAGIDAASNGDTVVVAPGTYYEHIDFKGKAIEVRSSAGAPSTIIDGGGTSTVVVFKSGETRASVLRGFTVTHGFIPPSGGPGLIAGAGVGMSDSSPTITENIAGIGAAFGAPLIKDNYNAGNHTTATGAGGGILAGGGAEIVMNGIENNTAGGGGGVVIYGGTPTIQGNLIRGNHATSSGGGGVRINGAGGTFVDNLIVGNVSDGVGGGVYWEHGGTTNLPYFLDNTVADNQAPTGSAIAAQSGGATLVNNVVTGTSASAIVWCSAGAAAAVTFSHNDVYTATGSPYQGCADPTGANGNVSADPRIPAPGTLDYRPQPGSPAIDAGYNTATALAITDYFGDPRVTDGDGDGVAVVDMGAVESATVPASAERYHALAPARILDTRVGLGAPTAKLGPASTLALQVTGQGGVPSSGVSAVVLNVTVAGPTSDGYLTAWPAGVPRPVVSNLNFAAGQTVPNLVVVKVGTGGQVDLFNAGGSTDVIADVAGWYGGPAIGARYFGATPARILDTRIGLGAPATKVGPASTLALQVTGRGGVPASGVSAVVLNVTVTESTGDGYITAWPAGVPRPVVSNLNFAAGQTVPNLVVVALGAGGQVSLFNAGGSSHLIADVAGWYGEGGAVGGTGFSSATPARVLDTRIGLGAPTAKLAPGGTLALPVTGRGGVPATGVSAVVLNVTVTGPVTGGWLTAWPAGESRPLASNLNYTAGQTVPNLVVVKVGAGGQVDLYSSGGPVDVIADVAGWFS